MFGVRNMPRAIDFDKVIKLVQEATVFVARGSGSSR